MQNFNREGGVISWVNTGTAVAAGDIVDLGGRVGIAMTAIGAGATGSVLTSGVVTLAKDSSTIAQEAVVYLSAAGKATTTQTAGKPRIGVAVEAAGSSAGYVDVEVNVGQTAGRVTVASGAGDAAGNAAAIRAIISALEVAGVLAKP